MSESRRAWVALNLVPLAPRHRCAIAEAFCGPVDAFRCKRELHELITQIKPELADKIVNIDWMSSADREIAKAKKHKFHILTPACTGYPERLNHLSDPPAALYVRGQWSDEDLLSVAVVGSRKATDYGLTIARVLGRDLAGRGVTVVSGLARGADGAAHRGALDAGGRTVAVLGCGLDIAYPRLHWRLQEKVAAAGALISEFPLGTGAARWTFPQRNRLLAALTLATVVVEAAAKSGSLITADFAAELGREVCAVPGRVTAEHSLGTNALIHDGATLVRSAGDVIGALSAEWRARARPAGLPVDAAALGLGEAEARVLSRVGTDQPVHLDALARQAGLTLGPLLDALLALEVRRLVRSLPGGRYVRAADLAAEGARPPLCSRN